jgi:hypothetical protein
MPCARAGAAAVTAAKAIRTATTKRGMRAPGFGSAMAFAASQGNNAILAGALERDRWIVREINNIARELCRGATRLLWQQGFTSLTEVPLANGRRADILALGRDGEIRIVEIKSSLADFRADRKWPEYRDFCDRLYFAVGNDFDESLIPEDCGLIRADSWGGAMLRDAPLLPLPAPRRRAMTLRFALLSGQRLSRVLDPDFAPFAEL